MYTGRKSKTWKCIPPAEAKGTSSSEFFSPTEPEEGAKKSAKKKATSSSVGKRAKKNEEDFLKGKMFYFVAVDLPKVRRELLSKRVEEHGGKIAQKLDIDGEKHPFPNYVIVDDRLSLETLCRSLDENYPQSKKLLEFVKVVDLVRSKWLSLCLHDKKLQDDAQWKINIFVENHIRAAGQEIPVHSDEVKDDKRKHLTYTASRDESPERDQSYHSDTDHRSDISALSDLDEDDHTDEDVAVEDNEDGNRAAKLQKNNFFLSAAGSSKKGGVNQHIIDQLEEMMKTYRNIGDEFRAYAYARALSAIRKYPDPIVGPDQIKQLKNVGPRIASHILEILETGHCEKLQESTQNDDANKAMSLFVNIHGVGTKTAQRWVQMGLRTLEDVKNKVSLTPEQTIGLKYYDEFQEKMPRKEVEEIAEIVQQTVSTIKSGFIFQICGSYCRGRDMCGDVDLLMTHPDGHSHETILKPLLDRLYDMKFLTDDLMLTEGRHKKYFGVCKLPKEGSKHRRLDIIIPPYKEWATCVLGWSGSMYFVRSIRDYAHKKGMWLTDYSLNKNVVRVNGERVNEGDPVETPTEEAVFQALGLPYLRPEERDH